MGFLLVAGPVILLAAGIVSLRLALDRRSQGSRRWRWARNMAALAVVMSLFLFALNFIEAVNKEGACAGLTG